MPTPRVHESQRKRPGRPAAQSVSEAGWWRNVVSDATGERPDLLKTELRNLPADDHWHWFEESREVQRPLKAVVVSLRGVPRKIRMVLWLEFESGGEMPAPGRIVAPVCGDLECIAPRHNQDLRADDAGRVYSAAYQEKVRQAEEQILNPMGSKHAGTVPVVVCYNKGEMEYLSLLGDEPEPLWKYAVVYAADFLARTWLDTMQLTSEWIIAKSPTASLLLPEFPLSNRLAVEMVRIIRAQVTRTDDWSESALWNLVTTIHDANDGTMKFSKAYVERRVSEAMEEYAA